MAVCMALLTACPDFISDPNANPFTPSPPPQGSSTVQVEVADGLDYAPFDQAKTLTVPNGYGIKVWARMTKPRFMALAPNGDVLVSQPGNIDNTNPGANPNGKIWLLRENPDGSTSNIEFASGLRLPHDMVFTKIGTTTYLYFTESNQISRTVYTPGSTKMGAREILISGLLDSSSSELRGAYGHQLKNIAIRGNQLYLSIASSSDADPVDTISNPKRGAIYVYDLQGKNPRLYAEGIRNAEGLDFDAQGNLWVVVNNRDNLPYPFRQDFDGDGSDDYGKVMQAYVDNHPPEEFVRVRDGGNYGWPFCNPNPDKGLDNMPFDLDFNTNADGNVDCNRMDRITKGIQAHSAPLGLTFLQDSTVKPEFRNGAVSAYHGCWNCSKYVGHKVAYFPVANGASGKEVDLVTGWITDPADKANGRWGRPVDVIPNQNGDLLISDDYANVIYKLYAK